jgi:hypothetical protein
MPYFFFVRQKTIFETFLASNQNIILRVKKKKLQTLPFKEEEVRSKGKQT